MPSPPPPPRYIPPKMVETQPYRWAWVLASTAGPLVFSVLCWYFGTH